MTKRIVWHSVSPPPEAGDQPPSSRGGTPRDAPQDTDDRGLDDDGAAGELARRDAVRPVPPGSGPSERGRDHGAVVRRS